MNNETVTERNTLLLAQRQFWRVAVCLNKAISCQQEMENDKEIKKN